MSEIEKWLRDLGLPQYANRFAENGIDSSVLRDLTDEDLKELGVLLGHRRKILRAIAELQGDTLLGADATPAAPDTAERRQLTVMFCDLADSTALSVRLDPEDMREVIRAYQDVSVRVIRAYDGFLAKYMGDGILAYFGYPHAHEDDAERGVRAGLEMVMAVGRLKTRVGVALNARIGIATGTVVVGDLVGEGVAQEQSVIGQTPNLAARLQNIAEPGTVVVAASTRQLLGDIFRLRDLGTHELKGLSRPVAAWAIEGAVVSDSRFEAVRSARLTGFIGRQREIALLLERQREAWQGTGQVVLISGEPGIGKSRIAATFIEAISAVEYTRRRYQCSPYHTNTALYPFIGQLERAAGFKPDDPPESKVEKIEALVSMATSQLEWAVPLIAALLSTPTGGRYPPLALSTAQQHRQTLAALLDQLEGLARRTPVLLLFEDAHWADATSLELLDLAIERVRQLPILVLITFRPEFEAPWTGLHHVTTVSLGRLDREQASAMIEQVTGGRKLPLEVTEQIVDKTDGIPLFIEELTKTVLESGLLVEEQGGYHLDRPLPPLAIPATLQDSLMARLDRLAPVKETAQIGAAIGREFSYALLGMVLERNQAGLDAALVQLESAELISRRGAPPDAVYTFKHALVQDTAYQSLLKSRRQILHHRIAMTLLGNFPTIAETEPAMVAHHFTQAGQTEDAVEWWSNAGDQARRRFAFADAIAHLGKAIHLAGTLPDTPEWRLVRLRLQIAYANAHLHARGPGAVEPTAAFARAREIAVGTGDAPERFSAYYGLWVGHFARGELALAREVAEAALRDILSRPNSSEASMVHRALGMTCYAEGNYVDARRHLEDSVAHYSSDNDRGMVWFGVDTAVATTVWLAIADWPLGEIDRACRLAEDMVLRAKQIGHVPTLVYAHSVICIFEAVRRASRQALIHSEATLVLAREHEMPLYLAIGTFFRGWAHSHIGDRETGLTEMREGLKLMGDQFPLQIPLVLELLAEEEAAGSLIDDALSLLDRALAAIERGHCAYSSEVHRSLGEILLRRDPVDIARVEGAFTRALEIARLQHTRTFELRAALSLARLYNATDRACAARELLESVVVGFDVRSELSELADARRLFEVQLARSA